MSKAFRSTRHSARETFTTSLQGLCGCLICLGVFASSSQAQTNVDPVAVWNVSGRATVGGGYRDNILLGSIFPQGSSYIETTADFSILRLSESGASLTLFAMGEWRRYLDSKEYQNEGIAYVVAGGGWPMGARNTADAEFQYFYQNQLLDVSETEATLRRALVLGNGFSLRPSWEHQLSEKWAVELEGGAVRQFYDGTQLDDYWEGLGRASLLFSYGHRSSLGAFYELKQRFYDTREQYDLRGIPVPDTDLVYRYDEVGAEWRHHWDAARRWRSVLKAGYLWNADNGSGYFDYDRVKVSAEVRWQQGKWDARVQGRAGWYVYPQQTSGGEERVSSYYALDFRAERQLDENWLVYAAASREWNLSNDPLDEYNDWLASGGIGVEF
jgi:hypothetical protein